MNRRNSARKSFSSQDADDRSKPVPKKARKSFSQNQKDLTVSSTSRIGGNKPASRKTKKSFSNSKTDSSVSLDSSDSMVISSSNTSLSSQKDIVNKFISFILVRDQKKKSIKKQDIITNVFINHDSKSYSTVLTKANLRLQKSLGLELLELKNRKNEYILINVLEPGDSENLEIRNYVNVSSVEKKKQGLIFFLLTIIYMNGNSISEDELWKALKPLGIDINSRPHHHHVFGDFKKLITVEFVTQMYLEYKCLSKDPPHFELSWGERAVQEVQKSDLLDFVCKIRTDTNPCDWAVQYNDANSSKDLEEAE